ncbi:MAG: LCP family protein [Candidatus Levybacteria bacterium]|nr:LCP family protein [Candidatus Levybacteria bacterium]
MITDTGLKSDRDRVNVLLLGTGGPGHEGPYLSDTMMLASIEKDGKDVVLISIPRDLWAPSLSAKINTAYAYGQERNENGLNLAKKTVRELFDLPIHYAFEINFSGYVNSVDLLDGLDLEVDTAFTDTKYPITGKGDDTCEIEIETRDEDGIKKVYFKNATGEATLLTEENDPFLCRYETISFKKGPTHLDGTTSLKFVRSRHGTNGQGSDFARSARQQKVILAFRQKVLSKETFLNPAKIIELTKTFEEAIDTDITSDEIPHFAKLVPKIDPAKIRRVVLDSERPESVLEIGNPQDHAGQFVLIPKNNNWADLAEYVQGEIFKIGET